MEIIGPDLHERECQLSINAADDTITDHRIAASRERYTAFFGARRQRPHRPDLTTTPSWCASARTGAGQQIHQQHRSRRLRRLQLLRQAHRGDHDPPLAHRRGHQRGLHPRM